jgi:hypothetical protein
VVKFADPQLAVCPLCGKSYHAVFECVVNGFYYDVAFIHMGVIRIPGLPFPLPAPAVCGPSVLQGADIKVDTASRRVHITQ